MIASSSTLGRLFVVGITSFVLVEACSSSAEPRGPAGEGGSAGEDAAPTAGSNVIAPDVSAPPQGGTSSAPNPLCGTGDCVPDSEQACADFVPAGGAPDGLAEAGASGAAGAAGASGEGGEGGVGGPGVSRYACRVSRASGEPSSECAPAGPGLADAPCFTSADCAAGFGCIDDGTVGRCRPFCCSGDASCDRFAGTYCGERALLETTPANGQVVPVCVPADACDLSKPPCEPGMAPGADCECADGTACLVVRADGVTHCAEPGAGTQNQPCPCDYGFVCSVAAGTCRTLCSLAEVGACLAGRCQASAELPDGWGVCIDP